MKKAYTKPMVMVESFELSQHIANCQHLINNKKQAIMEGCRADISEVAPNVFYTAIEGSLYPCITDGEDMYCYTKDAENTFVFSS